MPQAPTESQFRRYIAGLRDGDEHTLLAFAEAYRPALERLAGRRLERGMRRRVGPESIAQSVCRTFLRRAQAGQFELIDGDGLWGLLCAITLTKVREKVRFHRRQKRSLLREQPLDDVPAVPQPGASVDPAEVVAFAEQLEVVLGTFEAEERQILELRLLDERQHEIAETLGVSERTVRRKLRDMEQRLRAGLGDAGGFAVVD